MQDDKFNSDWELCKRYNEGDSGAKEEVFLMFYKTLVWYAYRYIRDKSVAEDLVMDVFLKIYRMKRQFASLDNIKCYLYVSVRNRCNDYLKDESISAKSIKESVYFIDEVELPKDKHMIHAETIKAVYIEIDKLPTQCRRVVKMRLIDQYSVDEISQELNISVKTVYNQIHLGIKSLRTSLLKKALDFLVIAYLLS